MRRKVEIRQEKSQINPTIITMSYGRSVGLSGFRAFDRRVSAAEAFCRVLSCFVARERCVSRPGYMSKKANRSDGDQGKPATIAMRAADIAKIICRRGVLCASVFPEVVASAANASALKGRGVGASKVKRKSRGVARHLHLKNTQQAQGFK